MNGKRRNRFHLDNSGSALITALVVSAVLLVLCLSLLLVSYALFSDVNEQNVEMPKRELAFSVAEEMEHELFDVNCDYATEEEMEAFYEASKDELWKYVRYNIWQNFGPGGQMTTEDTWLYYDEKTPGHNNLEECSRYFSMDTGSSASNITVQLYWELPEDFDGDTDRKEGTILHAVYRLYEDNEVSFKTEREYILDMGAVEPVVVNRYRVSFNSNGHGTAPEAQIVIETETAEEPDALTADGYDFKGWYTSPDCKDEELYDFSTPVTEHIILYAKWTRTLFDVTFSANGHGTAPVTQHVSYMNRVQRPSDPVVEGYEFGGWYTNPSCADTYLYDFNTPVTGDFTLYAKWTEINYYTVSFSLNGHGNTGTKPADQSVAEGEKATEPSEPMDNKMNFAGWYTDSGCTAGNNFSFNTPITEDITLYAKWTSGYVVTFVINNDDITNVDVPAPQSVGKNGKATQPENPVDKDGYFTFVNWYKDEECQHEYNFQAAVTESIYVYAKWRRIAYKVTFDENGHGTAPDPGPVLIGQPVTKPSDPSETGYDFGGWYKDAAGTAGNEWNFSTVISNSDVTLYAKWTPTEYTISYTLNDSTDFAADNSGNSSKTSFTVESPDITFTDATRTGYDFDGWYDASTGGNKVTDLYSGSRTADLSLYARWTAHDYSITYVLNDSTELAADNSGNTTTSFNVESGDISFADVTREAYTFTGWYDASTGGNRITGIAKGSRTSDITLYARYTAVPYTITYTNVGGADNSANPTTYTVEDTVIFNTSLTRTGYDPFGGWYNSSDEKVTGLAKGSKGNITLKGKWTPTVYNINYNLNGGSNSNSNPGTYTVETPDITFVSAWKTGYDFDGWYTESTGGSRVTGIAKGSRTGTLTLYAHWSPHNYSITYVLNNGTNHADNPSTYTINDTVTFQDPNKGPESTFIGWYTNADPKLGSKITGIAAGTTGDQTVYAIWATTSFNVIYITNTTEGENNGTVNTKVEYNQPASAPAVVKTGYKIEGWYEKADFSGSKWNFSTGITRAVTLYAKWQKEKYTVTFDSKGGSAVASATVEYGDKVPQPAAPTKSGFNFAGWYKDSACTNAWNFGSDTVTKNITLYAKWTQLWVVTFVANATEVRAQMPEPITVENGKTVAKPANPTDECFGFVNWYTDATCRTAYNFSTPVTGNVTLYAKWERKNFRVTFDFAGQREPVEVIVAANRQMPTADANAVKAIKEVGNYKVDGYYTTNTYRTTWSFTSTITKDTTVYVKLSLIKYTVKFQSNYSGSFFDSVSGMPSSQEVTKGSLISVDSYPYASVKILITWSVSAYCKGWYKDSACTQPWDFSTDTVNSNVTLYAGWVSDSDLKAKPAVSDKQLEPYQPEAGQWIQDNYGMFSSLFGGFNTDDLKATARKFWYYYVRDTKTADASSVLNSAQNMVNIPSAIYQTENIELQAFAVSAAGPLLYAAEPAGEGEGGASGQTAAPADEEPDGEETEEEPEDENPDSLEPEASDDEVEPLYIYLVPDAYKPVSTALNPNCYVINPRELWHWNRWGGGQS